MPNNSLSAALGRIAPGSPDAAATALRIVDGFFDGLCLATGPKRERLAACNLSEENWQIAAQGKEKLNHIGRWQTLHGQHAHMRELSDRYAQLALLVTGAALYPERQELASQSLQKPLNYKEKIEIVGFTAVRTRILEISRTTADRLHRTFDALQVYCRFPSTKAAVASKQVWIGDVADFQAEYEARYGVGHRDVKPHVEARIWDALTEHDHCLEAACHFPADVHALTFVVRSDDPRVSPLFFADSPKQQLSFDDVFRSSGQSFADAIRAAKQRIGKGINDHIMRGKA